MLGIWHKGDWMKRDLAQPIYGRVECGSPIFVWFIAFINEKNHSLDFDVKMYWCIYGFWWVICLLYLCSYYVFYIHIYPRGCYTWSFLPTRSLLDPKRYYHCSTGEGKNPSPYRSTTIWLENAIVSWVPLYRIQHPLSLKSWFSYQVWDPAEAHLAILTRNHLLMVVEHALIDHQPKEAQTISNSQH